jgi:hypothetical protein
MSAALQFFIASKYLRTRCPPRKARLFDYEWRFMGLLLHLVIHCTGATQRSGIIWVSAYLDGNERRLDLPENTKKYLVIGGHGLS